MMFCDRDSRPVLQLLMSTLSQSLDVSSTGPPTHPDTDTFIIASTITISQNICEDFFQRWAHTALPIKACHIVRIKAMTAIFSFPGCQEQYLQSSYP